LPHRDEARFYLSLAEVYISMGQRQNGVKVLDAASEKSETMVL
jgi:hypothetical protein